jgi:hypothetical protein
VSFIHRPYCCHSPAAVAAAEEEEEEEEEEVAEFKKPNRSCKALVV